MDVVAVVGLGYVGLPLAVAFGKIMPTIEYDLRLPKLDSYRQGTDPSGTVCEADLRTSSQLSFTSDATSLYEYTVYPGATEEVCIPVLERLSGLQWKRDFQVGYLPERINPGDKHHTLTNTVKVVADAVIFNMMGLDSSEVLAAARTCRP